EGYEFIVIFLWLSSAELAIQRVDLRVKKGGHFIPPDIIYRRYIKGIQNMVHYYLPLADDALICDNSGPKGVLSRIAEKRPQGSLEIHNHAVWTNILKVANV